MSELKRQYKDSSNLNARMAIYRYGAEGGFGPAQVLDLMLKAIPADADVLEVGCGPGWMWRSGLGRVPRSWRILLTDLTPGMTEEAIAALGNDERFRVRQMDVHTLDLPDASFDAVIANWMLYHVEDRPRALAEIRRVLKAGGALFAATNGDAHLGKIDLLVNEYLGDAAPTRGGSRGAAKARNGSPGKLRAPAHVAFSLENGEAQLSPFFASVAVHQGQGTLHITETEAVVQYALSFNESKHMIVGDRLDDLRRCVRDEIGVGGRVRGANPLGAVHRQKSMTVSLGAKVGNSGF